MSTCHEIDSQVGSKQQCCIVKRYCALRLNGCEVAAFLIATINVAGLVTYYLLLSRIGHVVCVKHPEFKVRRGNFNYIIAASQPPLLRETFSEVKSRMHKPQE